MPAFNTFETYLEPFGGSATMLLELLDALIEASKKIVYNDKYGELSNLLKVVAEHWEEFDREAQKLFCSRASFEEWEQFFADPTDNPPEWSKNYLKRAVRFLYVQNNSWDGKGSVFKGKPNSWYKAEEIKELSEKIKKHVIIENLDFEECIKRYDSERTFFLIDPPYYNLHYYKCDFTEDHNRLRMVVGEIKGMVLLTYNYCEPIKQMYKGYNIEKIVASNDVEHIVIRNYGNRKENLNEYESLLREVYQKHKVTWKEYIPNLYKALINASFSISDARAKLHKDLVETGIISERTFRRGLPDDAKHASMVRIRIADTMTAKTIKELECEEAQSHIRECQACRETLKIS